MNLKTIGLHFNLVEQIHSVRITGRWKMDLTACVLKMMFEYQFESIFHRRLEREHVKVWLSKNWAVISLEPNREQLRAGVDAPAFAGLRDAQRKRKNFQIYILCI